MERAISQKVYKWPPILWNFLLLQSSMLEAIGDWELGSKSLLRLFQSSDVLVWGSLEASFDSRVCLSFAGLSFVWSHNSIDDDDELYSQ